MPTNMKGCVDRYYIGCVLLCVVVRFICGGCCHAQNLCDNVVSLDSCRARALRCNKSLQIADVVVEQSAYWVRAARGAYLPGVDFAAAAFYNQKELQLVDAGMLRGKITDWGVPASIASAIVPDNLLAFDTHRVLAGVLTVVQPLFLGGKIVAANNLADNAKRLAQSQRRLTETEVITAVDDAYWLVISLVYKKRLAESFVLLVDTLNSHVNAMIAEGVATRSDGLAVSVALNEAEVALTKVDNGLSLSRMALAQLCGMALDTVFTLQDESPALLQVGVLQSYNLNGVYGRREELQSLRFLSNMAQAQQRMALSDMLPSIALMGMYTFNTPNLYDGFKTEIDGMFRVGVVMRVPMFHWGTNYYRYRASRCATVIAGIEIELAKERIALQVSQSRFRYDEAVRTYRMTTDNMKQAEENLRNAQLAYAEGIYSITEVLAAQTAWLQANSEQIDARIGVEVSRNAYNRAVGLPLY